MNTVESSVFQIFCEETYVQYTKPWTVSGHGKSSGTGFAVKIKDFIKNFSDDMFIMTNAHVIEFASYITVGKNNSTNIYRAKVEAIAIECDLAIISITGKGAKSKDTKHDIKHIREFWDGVKPLKFGNMPQKTDVVFAYGFPMGGENISITKGTVNRIKVLHYEPSAKGITIQTDTSINSGNSGGPALNNKDEVIGVVFATDLPEISQGNAGYIIPSILAKYFIKRIQKYKTFDGLCDIGIGTQMMHNAALREMYGMEPYQTGILVNEVDPHSDAYNKIKVDDVITKIDGINIYYDGMIKLLELLGNQMKEEEREEFTQTFRMDDQINFGTVVSLKMPGESVHIELLRSGEIKKVNVKVQIRKYTIPILKYQQKPSYLMVGGLIFMPLSSMLIDELEQQGAYTNHLSELPENVFLNAEGQQIIILTGILRSELTDGYKHENNILAAVNGVRILNLVHLQNVLKDSMKKDKFVIFDFCDTSDRIVLKSNDIASYTKQIAQDQLKTNITVLIP